MRFLTLVFAATGLCACTSHQVYDAVQASKRAECEQLQMVQRAECLKHLAPDYRDYERERQKLEKK